MTEIEKAEETIKWMNFFDIIRDDAYVFGGGIEGMNKIIKSKIDELKNQSNNIIQKELNKRVANGKDRS